MLPRISLLVLLAAACSAEPQLDGARIDLLTGAKGAWIEAEAVYKVSWPRTDVAVTVEGAQLPPFAGLTSWAAFTPGKKSEAMVMGDLVVFEDEIDAVMSAALDGGLAVTALHNHFLREEPRVFFMHVGGEGTVEALAAGVAGALAAVKEIRAAAPQPTRAAGRPLPHPSSVSAKPLEEILGVQGTAKDGMWKAVIGRRAVMPCGCEVGKEMGVNTWAAFAGSDADAIVDGDFATTGGELQPVLKALRASSLSVVAIHHHMERESPKMIFLHYWGRGKAADLAKGVRAALEAQGGVMKFDFNAEAAGALPQGWRTGTTNGTGKDALWAVAVKSPGDHMLSLTDPNGNEGGAFNLCWRADADFRDGAIEVRVRADAGKEDQGGGLIWRARDERNYYIARYNPLERNLRLYVVKDGTRRQLATAADLAIPAGEWFTLAIDHVADRIGVALNGKRLLEATDATFKGAGGIGFWTKADAATSFDDLRVAPEK